MNYLIKLINNIISSLFFSIFNYKLYGSIWSGFMIDENDKSIGYEGMRSFAIVKSNLTSDDLSYWLNQKELYAPGLMKAAYGTFLSPLLVIYENDRVADESASKFNVTWSRVSPICVSLCNDYNCLYITGDSNHIMGREAVGNASGVWSFNFATSFSFSLIEQLVGNNVWNTTKIGSVTLGLIESYMNNKTLELFSSNGYIFIKHTSDNNTLLFLDLKTGIVRDCFNYYGLLGTMPCYHDNITENAWKYGNNLLDKVSKEFNQFNFLYIVSSCCSIIGSSFIVELGTLGSSIINPIGLAAIYILLGFQVISPFLAEISRNNSLYSIADFYDLDLLAKIGAWIDYYFYQDGIIMDGINKFNTNFYIENHEQIELNKKQRGDFIKNCMIEANKMNIQFQFLIGASDSKPKPWMLPTIIVIATSFLTSKIGELINSNYLSNNRYSYDEYFLNLEVKPNIGNSIIINQTILNN